MPSLSSALGRHLQGEVELCDFEDASDEVQAARHEDVNVDARVVVEILDDSDSVLY